MDVELQKKLDELDAKVESIWQSVEKTRKYFQITLWITIILFVLPLLGLMYAVPKALNSFLTPATMEDIQGLQGLY